MKQNHSAPEKAFDSINQENFDARELFNTLWQEKWVVIAVATFVVAVGVTYALLSQPIYRSEALLQIREDGKVGGGGLASLAGQLGGVADFAGVALQPAGGNRAVAIATLKSRFLIQKFIEDKNLLPILFEKKWDAGKGSWATNDPKKQPSLQDGYKLVVTSILNVLEEKRTGLVTISVEWRDPRQAADWVAELVRRTNLTLKNKTIEEGQRNLSYLEEQSKATAIVEVQKSIYSLMESELKKIMIAKSGDDFALKIIDPPESPEKRIRPKRTLIAMFSAFAGVLLGLLMALIFSSFKNRKTN